MAHRKGVPSNIRYSAAVLAVGKAAINRAFKRGELTRVPHILMMKKQDAGPRGDPNYLKSACASLDALVR